MDILNHEIIFAICNSVTKHIKDRQEEIDTALADDAVSISLPVKISNQDGAIVVRTGISFSTGKVKDEDVEIFDPNQRPLPMKYSKADDEELAI